MLTLLKHVLHAFSEVIFGFNPTPVQNIPVYFMPPIHLRSEGDWVHTYTWRPIQTHTLAESDVRTGLCNSM